MIYYSLKHKEKVSFEEALFNGQAKDGSLYFPSSIPKWDKNFVQTLHKKNKVEIGFNILRPFIGGTMKDDVLTEILTKVLSFDIPLKKISNQIYTLELYHGPTLAFKDIGAKFLSLCLQHQIKKEEKRNTIVLVATSGDTGSAVADAFNRIEGIDVVILYPSGKVSPVQEKQLTTYGNNIHALEVKGDFDDCQRLVKQAFLDVDLNNKFQLTSSNSINIARWISQQVYYAIGIAQWKEKEMPIVSVPSGNFGNLAAGLLAKSSGLPIKHFVAACNNNKGFLHYLETGLFKASRSITTPSNAMDVGNPSNLPRIIELYQNNLDLMRKDISCYSISDEETEATIAEIENQYKYTLDPHAAVAYASLRQHLSYHPDNKGLILGTAHPIKFPEIVEKAIKKRLDQPVSIKKLFLKEKKSQTINADYEAVKSEIVRLG